MYSYIVHEVIHQNGKYNGHCVGNSGPKVGPMSLQVSWPLKFWAFSHATGAEYFYKMKNNVKEV